MALRKGYVAESPSTNRIVAIRLLEVFLVAIIAALTVTISNVPQSVQALAAVMPFIVLSIIFIYYCKKGMAWGFAGASILGAAGVVLRIIVSTQPALEVGGGLPVGVTVLYIVLSALVSLKNYEAFIELTQK